MDTQDSKNISIIIPAKNEAESLSELIHKIRQYNEYAEIIVVNDGSTDDTASIAEEQADIHIQHPISMGNGAAIKSGARAASRDILVMLDADGQHQAEDISALLLELTNGYKMVVGSRDSSGQANKLRLLANNTYNILASYITGHKINDLTSGFRVTYRKYFYRFIDLLPNGFSYPTTITMAYFRSGLAVKYHPINVRKRAGKSHIRPIHDGIRFFLIIFKVTMLYSPLKLFTPVSLGLFFLSLTYYSYTFITDGRFTNMGVLLLLSSVLTFMVGLVSEQITQLLYVSAKDKNNLK